MRRRVDSVCRLSLVRCDESREMETETEPLEIRLDPTLIPCVLAPVSRHVPHWTRRRRKIPGLTKRKTTLMDLCQRRGGIASGRKGK